MSDAYEAAQEIKAALQQLTEEAAPTRRERIAGLVMAHLAGSLGIRPEEPGQNNAIARAASMAVRSADALLLALDAVPTVPAPSWQAGKHTPGSGL